MKAFPYILDEKDHQGMDLRDYFAAKAMQALMSHETFINAVSAQRVPPSALVKQAYMFADLMMEARNESL
jgi:hypothetical protein